MMPGPKLLLCWPWFIAMEVRSGMAPALSDAAFASLPVSVGSSQMWRLQGNGIRTIPDYPCDCTGSVIGIAMGRAGQ